MKKIINTLLLSIVVAGLTSCLKDKAANIDPNGSPAVVEWSTTNTGDAPASPVGSTYTLYSRSYDLMASVPMVLNVNYTGGADAPEDITVGLGINAAAITAYNTQQKTSFTLLPPELYTMPASVVIPKGQRKATVTILVKTNAFNLGLSYALPVAITSTTAGNISGNYGTVLYSISAKNQYDGIYTMNGNLIDNTSTTLTGFYPLSMQLITTGESSVALYDGITVTSNYAHPIKSGTSNSSYGNFSPVFNIDPATGNVTSITNYFGQGNNTSFRSAKLDPTGVNKYDAATKTLKVKYIMVQSGSDRTFFDETFTYKSPRG